MSSSAADDCMTNKSNLDQFNCLCIYWIDLSSLFSSSYHRLMMTMVVLYKSSSGMGIECNTNNDWFYLLLRTIIIVLQLLASANINFFFHDDFAMDTFQLLLSCAAVKRFI